MSGEGSCALNIRGSGCRSLETTAALYRVPLDEVEELLKVVEDGVISKQDAIESIEREGIRVQGVY